MCWCIWHHQCRTSSSPLHCLSTTLFETVYQPPPNPHPLLASLPGNIAEIGGDLWPRLFLVLLVWVFWIVGVVSTSLLTIALLRDAVLLHPTSVVSHWCGLLHARCLVLVWGRREDVEWGRSREEEGEGGEEEERRREKEEGEVRHQEFGERKKEVGRSNPEGYGEQGVGEKGRGRRWRKTK